MNEADNFLWQALEGALGTEKVSFLRYAPLTDVIGARPDFSAADAAGHIAKEAMYAADERRAINAGVRALRELGDVPIEKTASLSDKVALARKMRIMMSHSGEKTASAEPYKQALYEDIVETIKTATVGSMLEGISKNPALRQAGKNMLTAGGTAAGVAVPAVAAGSYLSDQFTEDARNRALQTAAGVGALGLAGYGGVKAIDQMALDRTRDKNYQAMEDFHSKMSSLGQVMGEEKAAHLATACYLDELLSSVEQTEKIASIRQLNREFIVEGLLTKEAMGLRNPLKAVSDAFDLASDVADARSMGILGRTDWGDILKGNHPGVADSASNLASSLGTGAAVPALALLGGGAGYVGSKGVEAGMEALGLPTTTVRTPLGDISW